VLQPRRPLRAKIKDTRTAAAEDGTKRMTIDERIERLTERHEALTQSIELMHSDWQERWQAVAARSPASPNADCPIWKLDAGHALMAMGTVRSGRTILRSI